MSDPAANSPRPVAYEALLEHINTEVEGFAAEGAVLEHPVLFVVGTPRSGTTLLTQVLAATGAFAYPTNLIARFYRSPAYGASIQRLLAPLLSRGPMAFTSAGGATPDWWGPHEFGWFWRRHLPLSPHQEPETVGSLDGLVSDLAAFSTVTGRPLLFKETWLTFVLGPLAAALPTARFVHIDRDPLDTAVSVWRQRIRHTGSPSGWFGLRPRGDLSTLSPEDQIAVQLHRTRAALVSAASSLGDRWMRTDYPSLCADPHGVIRTVSSFLERPLSTADVPDTFSRPASEPLPERSRLAAALSRLEHR